MYVTETMTHLLRLWLPLVVDFSVVLDTDRSVDIAGVAVVVPIDEYFNDKGWLLITVHTVTIIVKFQCDLRLCYSRKSILDANQHMVVQWYHGNVLHNSPLLLLTQSFGRHSLESVCPSRLLRNIIPVPQVTVHRVHVDHCGAAIIQIL